MKIFNDNLFSQMLRTEISLCSALAIVVGVGSVSTLRALPTSLSTIATVYFTSLIVTLQITSFDYLTSFFHLCLKYTVSYNITSQTINYTTSLNDKYFLSEELWYLYYVYVCNRTRMIQFILSIIFFKLSWTWQLKVRYVITD